MDTYLFEMINNLAGQFNALDTVMKMLSSYAPYVYVGILLFYLIRKQSRVAAITGFASVALAMGVSYVIKHLFYRPRPFVDGDVNLLLSHDANSSFPSDHTTAAVAIACVIFSYNRKMGTVLIGLALLMGFSRIYVGHHYPTDVLAGVLFGLVPALIVLGLARKLFVKRRYGSYTGS